MIESILQRLNKICYRSCIALSWALAAIPTVMAQDDAYKTVVAPFLTSHCLKCHSVEKPKGDLTLSTLKPDIAANPDTWQEVLRQLRSDEMPPAKEPRPDKQNRAIVVAWIEAGLTRVGKATTRPQPQYGNEIPHEALFDPANATRFASTPARYWRLSPYIYRKYMAKQHATGGNLVAPFNLLPGNGFKDYALPAAIDEPTAALLWINAESIVNSRLRIDPNTGKLDKPQYKEIAEAFDETKPLAEATLTKVVKSEFLKILGRMPTSDELTRWLALLEKNIAAGGRVVGVRMTLTVLYLHPEVLYRKEIGDGPADVHGRRLLSPHELTLAIAYSLGDQGPDNTLRKAADAGKLTTSADVSRELLRLFNDPKYEKPRVMRFFHEYFGYTSAVSVFKTDFTHGLHLPSDNVDDTEMLIGQILAQDKNVLRELLSTPDICLITDPGGDKRHKPFYVYNFPGPQPYKGVKRERVPAPSGQRAGILTQPSWLIAHSTNFDNHAITRGHWIRERLLGGMIPEIPINVDAKLPDDKDQSLRERMHVTRETYCWRCHQRMDPLGMPFEMYNHFGRYRETETVLDHTAPAPAKGKPQATRELPLDASGAITGSGDAQLDGPVKNAVEMMQKLAGSKHVEQVFVRHVFRYWMGRNETLADAGTLQAAHKAYQDSGGSFRALVVSLLTSDAFLYRTGEAVLPTMGK